MSSSFQADVASLTWDFRSGPSALEGTAVDFTLPALPPGTVFVFYATYASGWSGIASCSLRFPDGSLHTNFTGAGNGAHGFPAGGLPIQMELLFIRVPAGLPAGYKIRLLRGTNGNWGIGKVLQFKGEKPVGIVGDYFGEGPKGRTGSSGSFPSSFEGDRALSNTPTPDPNPGAGTWMPNTNGVMVEVPELYVAVVSIKTTTFTTFSPFHIYPIITTAEVDLAAGGGWGAVHQNGPNSLPFPLNNFNYAQICMYRFVTATESPRSLVTGVWGIPGTAHLKQVQWACLWRSWKNWDPVGDESHTWPSNLVTTHRWFYAAWVNDEGNVKVARARTSRPITDLTVTVTNTGSTTRPVLYEGSREELGLVWGYENTPTFEVRHSVSTDDAETWSEPVAMFDGTSRLPWVCSDPISRQVAAFAYVGGFIRGRVKGPGESAFGAEFTLRTASDDLEVEEDTFGVSFAGDAQGRALLTVRLLGDTEPTTLTSFDDCRTWA